MYADARKIHLIEQVLKVNNDETLMALEGILGKKKKPVDKKHSIHDFVGIFSKEETSEVRKIIRETSETIDADAWK